MVGREIARYGGPSSYENLLAMADSRPPRHDKVSAPSEAVCRLLGDASGQPSQSRIAVIVASKLPSSRRKAF